MKIGAFILLLVLSSSAILRADATFWNNGIALPQWIGNDSNGTGTGPGYTVYDDFTVPNNVTTITGLSYTDILNYGSWSDYVSTNWSLFFNASDPFGVPLYSGTAVFTMTPQGNGLMLFSVTSLSIPVSSGHWYVGFQNNFSSNMQIVESSRAGAAGNGLPGWWQQDNTKGFQTETPYGDTAFAVSGTSIGEPSPEPSSLVMLGSGMLGIAAMVRRKFLG